MNPKKQKWVAIGHISEAHEPSMSGILFLWAIFLQSQLLNAKIIFSRLLSSQDDYLQIIEEIGSAEALKVKPRSPFVHDECELQQVQRRNEW